MLHFMRLCALLVVLLTTLAGPVVALADQLKIDFQLLYRAAQLANQAYDGQSEILGKYPGDSAWVSTPGKNNVQYVLLFNDARKI